MVLFCVLRKFSKNLMSKEEEWCEFKFYITALVPAGLYGHCPLVTMKMIRMIWFLGKSTLDPDLLYTRYPIIHLQYKEIHLACSHK